MPLTKLSNPSEALIYIFDLITAGLPFTVLNLAVQPYQRGFFCDDESLMHPYHEDTISMSLLVPVGLFIPLFLVRFMFTLP